MSNFIPEEIVTRILTRVPAKSLIRFRCVSKSWKSLISSPDFISLHTREAFLSKPTIPDDRMLVRCYSKPRRTELYSVHHDNEDFTVASEVKIDFPFRRLAQFYFRIVGFCNGLLCLSEDFFGYRNLIMLWNPSIRRKMILPVPRAGFENLGAYMSVVGFGYDVKNNDFKVVRIAYDQSRRGYKLPPIVEVFALSVGDWREIDVDLAQNWVIENLWTQAFVNGKVHWVAYRLNEEKENLIMVFDLSNEVFEELLLPDALAVECPINMCTSVCEDSIAVLNYDKRVGTGSCSIWLMKVYGDVKSWSKMYTVDLEGELGKVLSFRKDGNILLTASDGELCSYDPDPRLQEIKYIGILGTKDSFFVGRYTESLALLIEGEEELEGLPNAADSGSSEDGNGGEDCEVEKIELWKQSILVGFLKALLLAQ
ncbi:F-box/kelch-repeat protein At3g23880-like [Coffea arabica]|uniref:F-box/kelch-repeat protein At3g23880-like n=1 Tax=Coffea arabica TaxID=13443 RepID=A0A6P6XHP1_COFAR